MSDTPSLRWLSRLGLAPKLLASTAFFILAACAALTAHATAQLERDLTAAFEAKGDAIALAMAAAAERSALGDPLIVQKTMEANKRLSGVKYIYVADAAGQVYGHTFVEGFPEGLSGKNRLAPGESLPDEARVKIGRVTYGDGGERAIDLAAPVARGTAGSIHVGMEPAVIDAEVGALRSSMILWGLTVSLLGAACSLLVAVFAVIRPVRELTRVTTDIATRGDLTQAIRVRSNDEIGRLARAFELMVAKLRAIPTSLQESTRLLSASVARLSSSAEAQSQTVARQAAALQETQVTAQEIKQTSLVAAQKADAVLRYAERAEAVSKIGEAAVDESLGALTDIRAQVEEIARRITSLGEHAAQIGNVTQTVKDLADQSNMLALNAAIEAVRSGEHGKGFAVVAREIRTLADQSVQATKQVREMLDDISRSIRAAVAITDKGASRIDAGLSQVKTSGEKLAELSGIVKENSLAVRQISAAVGQQNAGIAQIFSAVSDQSSMMNDTVVRLSASDESVKTLREVTERLVAVVEQFQVLAR